MALGENRIPRLPPAGDARPCAVASAGGGIGVRGHETKGAGRA